MSRATSSDLERVTSNLTAGTERVLAAVERDASNETLSATAAELGDVVAEFEDLLGTIDFEQLPDAVDASALPDAVDLTGLPAAVREKNPDPALDFGAIRDAISVVELWNTVDLVDFGTELKQLRAELEDVVGPDVLDSNDDDDGDGDSAFAADVEEFVAEVKPEATNVALQQKAQSAAKAARNGVIDGHSTFETLYESTQRGPGYAGRRPVSKNPTAVSSVPHGPLPASVSTRVSTVPANVRGAKVDALPRIYGRRWRTARNDR